MVKRKSPNLDKIIEEKRDKVDTEVIRCEWVSNDPLYIAYHDYEWGKPVFNSTSLFEILCLEGQQAGLSWITVLKKRDHYRKLFKNFSPHEVSKLKKSDIEKFSCDPGVIRHRGKLESIVENAKCFLKMESNEIDFSDFVWSFVNKRTIVNSWSNIKEVPTHTAASTALSTALKKRGFKFIGSTICYAFMQAAGLVNDHTVDCICYAMYNK